MCISLNPFTKYEKYEISLSYKYLIMKIFRNIQQKYMTKLLKSLIFHVVMCPYSISDPYRWRFPQNIAHSLSHIRHIRDTKRPIRGHRRWITHYHRTKPKPMRSTSRIASHALIIPPACVYIQYTAQKRPHDRSQQCPCVWRNARAWPPVLVVCVLAIQ